jgi:hypothetical protein
MANEAEIVKGLNPTVAIALAIVIASAMVLGTTLSFLHSGAYTTVKQIQLGIETTESMDQGGLDITSPINAIDIDDYANSIDQRIKLIDDYADFGPEAVSDAQLGL